MRKAIDTNVLIRALVDENNEQSRLAASILTSEAIHVPLTVMLEAEWVLRSSYRFAREKVCELLGSVMGLDNVEVDRRESVGDAITAHKAGFDFADALHVELSKQADVFLTFDKKLLKISAQNGSPIPVQEPQAI